MLLLEVIDVDTLGFSLKNCICLDLHVPLIDEVLFPRRSAARSQREKKLSVPLTYLDEGIAQVQHDAEDTPEYFHWFCLVAT